MTPVFPNTAFRAQAYDGPPTKIFRGGLIFGLIFPSRSWAKSCSFLEVNRELNSFVGSVNGFFSKFSS
jgi:hypothetical protein